MKKLLFVFLIGCFSFQNYAQNGALYQDWYLISYELEGENHSITEINPSISPSLYIDQDLGFTGFAACNNYIGNFSYDEINDSLILDSFDATLTLCDFPSQDNFETDYFSLFTINQVYSYDIIYDADYEYLELELSPGNILYYRNAQLFSTDNFSTETFSIYPNPVSSILYISSEINNIEAITIYLANGIKAISIENKNNSIDISNLSNGLYFVEISSKEGKLVKKFIKK